MNFTNQKPIHSTNWKLYNYLVWKPLDVYRFTTLKPCLTTWKLNNFITWKRYYMTTLNDFDFTTWKQFDSNLQHQNHVKWQLGYHIWQPWNHLLILQPRNKWYDNLDIILFYLEAYVIATENQFKVQPRTYHFKTNWFKAVKLYDFITVKQWFYNVDLQFRSHIVF